MGAKPRRVVSRCVQYSCDYCGAARKFKVASELHTNMPPSQKRAQKDEARNAAAAAAAMRRARAAQKANVQVDLEHTSGAAQDVSTASSQTMASCKAGMADKKGEPTLRTAAISMG